jgi:hypothetical protein
MADTHFQSEHPTASVLFTGKCHAQMWILSPNLRKIVADRDPTSGAVNRLARNAVDTAHRFVGGLVGT